MYIYTTLHTRSRAVDFGRISTINPPNLNGYQLFFQRCVPVPPNKFRPMAKGDDRDSLHAHSVLLTTVLQCNDTIKKIMVDERIDELTIIPTTTATTAATATNADGTPAVPVPMVKKDYMSSLVSAWIDLQNAVNVYIDSSKDPNPLAKTSNTGLRQLLEKKQGLFRMHMMGKRVNYCARSVISPDPYIGTNEVGLPVAFAKALHYPTPVNDWNIKHMRRLVENGCDEYPGRLCG